MLREEAEAANRRKGGGAFQSPKEMTAALTEFLSSLHVRVPGQYMKLSQSTQGFGRKTGTEGKVYMAFGFCC